jgi:hypothetical protein
MAVFTVTVNVRSAAFGERKDQERSAIVQVLENTAGNVGSGAPLITSVKDRNGVVVATAAWGVDAINP